MFAPLPESAIVKVERTLSRDLLAAAKALPEYDNREFYSTELQTRVRDHFEQGCHGFEDLVGRIEQRLSKWPYCVLVNGLSFDEGNKIFIFFIWIITVKAIADIFNI